MDLDGTLLPESKELTARTRQVMQKIAALGVRLALASGKFYHLTRHYADLLGPDTPVVALDGARIRFGPEETTTGGIPREVAQSLLEEFGAAEEPVFADNGADEMVLALPDGDGEIPLSIQTWATRIQRVTHVGRHMAGDPAVVVFYHSDPARLQKIAAAAMRRFPAMRATIAENSAYSTGRVILQRDDVTKGSGVATLCAGIGIEPGQCMVFGDWFNDLPMFDAGCVNVAMHNGQPKLRERADHITRRDCEHDGVADFLERAFL